VNAMDLGLGGKIALITGGTSGIGLAIAARIVHLHRGRIWAEGTPEQGATVFFVLEPQPNR